MDDPLRPARTEIFEKRGSRDPDAVELEAENVDAAMVFMLTRFQIVTAGMGQAVDISIPAVKVAMDLYGVSDQLTCLNRVRRLFHHFAEKDDAGRGLETG